MAKVIKFALKYPCYHPKKGQKTFFVEKFWKSLWVQNKDYDIHLFQEPYDDYFHPMGKDLLNIKNFQPKHHTIRSGNRFKAGEFFTPQVWRERPYHKCFDKDGHKISSVLTIGPDTLIEKVYSISKYKCSKYFYINGSKVKNEDLLFEIAKNDGLLLKDLLLWFKYPKPFSGQIICWSKEINYEM